MLTRSGLILGTTLIISKKKQKNLAEYKCIHTEKNLQNNPIPPRQRKYSEPAMGFRSLNHRDFNDGRHHCKHQIKIVDGVGKERFPVGTMSSQPNENLDIKHNGRSDAKGVYPEMKPANGFSIDRRCKRRNATHAKVANDHQNLSLSWWLEQLKSG